jgi:homoserine dehydrogenase
MKHAYIFSEVDEMNTVRVGLLGLGTVGTGVLKTIQLQEQKLTQRIGKKVEIVKVLVKDLSKERQVNVDTHLLTTYVEEVFDANIDVLIEVMGGLEPTFDYVSHAIKRGCHIVTANKELLAKRGCELISLANEHQVHFYYEASVAGGIPILNVLRHLLKTNDINKIQGILNGTTNYIVSQMEGKGREYNDVLQEAQQIGYAEADPTSDVEGFDALYKLYILSQLLFGEAPELTHIERKGIAQLSKHEIQLARELGYRIRLIASAERKGENLELSVRPGLLPLEHPLSMILDANNGVLLHGNLVGDLAFTGKGAGELPTASAVIEDLAYLLTQVYTPQQEWRKQSDQTISFNRELSHIRQWGTSPTQHYFIFLESKKKDFSLLYHILEILEKENVVLLQVKTEDQEGEVTRIGLVVIDITQNCLTYFEHQLGLKVSSYPILEENSV